MTETASKPYIVILNGPRDDHLACQLTHLFDAGNQVDVWRPTAIRTGENRHEAILKVIDQAAFVVPLISRFSMTDPALLAILKETRGRKGKSCLKPYLANACNYQMEDALSDLPIFAKKNGLPARTLSDRRYMQEFVDDITEAALQILPVCSLPPLAGRHPGFTEESPVVRVHIIFNDKSQSDKSHIRVLREHWGLLEDRGQITVSQSEDVAQTAAEKAAISESDIVLFTLSADLQDRADLTALVNAAFAAEKFVIPMLSQSVNLAGTGLEKLAMWPRAPETKALRDVSAAKRDTLFANMVMELNEIVGTRAPRKSPTFS